MKSSIKKYKLLKFTKKRTPENHEQFTKLTWYGGRERAIGGEGSFYWLKVLFFLAAGFTRTLLAKF